MLILKKFFFALGLVYLFNTSAVSAQSDDPNDASRYLPNTIYDRPYSLDENIAIRVLYSALVLLQWVFYI